jgi:hypothetical protein
MITTSVSPRSAVAPMAGRAASAAEAARKERRLNRGMASICLLARTLPEAQARRKPRGV